MIGGLGREVRFRIAQAWDAFNRRKRKLFGSPLVPVADKQLLFETLIVTVLFYGAGTWSEVARSPDCFPHQHIAADGRHRCSGLPIPVNKRGI